MFEADFPRLARIGTLLDTQDYGALETLVHEELPHRLLSEPTLDAARALRHNATVVFLATLAVENLPKPIRFQTWLAIYQSLLRGQSTPEFAALPARQPLRLVAEAAIRREALDPVALRKGHGGIDDWFAAAELAIDQLRFDLLEQVVRELVRRKIDAQDGLRLTKVLFNRHPFIPKSVDTDALGRCYSRLRDHLIARLPAVDKVRSRLALFATHCHFHSGNYPAAIEAAQRATTVEDRIHAAFDIARSHCFSGDLDQTLVWLDRLVELMCQHGPIHAPQPAAQVRAADEPEPDKEARNTFDPVQASQALLDLQNALAPIGKKAFLVSGTLLGFHREGGLLAHDKDIDVGIIGWEDQYEVANALLQSGRFGLDSRRLRGRKTYHIPVRHIETRVSIDIFVYHEEDGKLVTGVESYFGYLQKFAFTPFGLDKVGFLGIEFYVPNDIERNLAENFGNWRQSDPDYISHLQSPSTVDVGGKVFQIVGRIRALEAIKAGKFEKLSRVIQLMTEHRHRPGGMSAHTLDLLRAAYDQRPVEEVV
jgi:hypothetical protein